ncbi:MAG: hypothetical protein ABR585_15455, partial [Gemmatimonadaceae bacterium]
SPDASKITFESDLGNYPADEGIYTMKADGSKVVRLTHGVPNGFDEGADHDVIELHQSGLDNVLAVAGAAHGSFALVAAGLLISIPIVVWGSTLVLKLLERFHWVLHVGVAVLQRRPQGRLGGPAGLPQPIDRQPPGVGVLGAEVLDPAGDVECGGRGGRRRRQARRQQHDQGGNEAVRGHGFFSAARAG